MSTSPSRKRRPEDLRSHRWYGVDDLRAFGHRSRMLQMGFSESDFRGKPVIGIVNTWSELSPCHFHFRTRAEEVKRGVWQAGGFPVELPAHPVTEQYMKPTSMLYRNLLAMETEELARSQPVDGLVLLGGCDKTPPALVMGAISAGLPAIFMPAGPPPITPADAQNFQRAARIRDAFYPGVGGGGLRFEIIPRAFDPNANGAVIEVEGTRTEITRAGPFRPIALSWPARGGLTLTFDPPSSAGPITYDGGWSGLRLALRPQSRLTATRQPDRLNLTVSQGDRTAEFELRTGSATHPFGMPELREFRCPTLPP